MFTNPLKFVYNFQNDGKDKTWENEKILGHEEILQIILVAS